MAAGYRKRERERERKKEIQRKGLRQAAAVMLQRLLCDRGGEMRLGFAKDFGTRSKKAKRCDKAMCIKGDDGHSPQRQSAQCKIFPTEGAIAALIDRFMGLGDATTSWGGKTALA